MEPALARATQGGKAASTTGWILIILGILAMLLAPITGAAITIALGIVLLVGGIGGLRSAWAHRAGDGWMPILVSALTAIAGLLFLFNVWFGMKLLTMMLIIYFGATGLLRILAGFQLKPRRGWGWLVFDGVVSFVLGAMLWSQFPNPAKWLLGLLFGIQLLFSGIVMLVTGKAVQDIAGAMQDEVDAAGAQEAEVLQTRTEPSDDA